MSKKRTSAESYESSEARVSKKGNAKRAKLDLLNNKTLQDLPVELIQSLFVEVVAMEVKDWFLAKNDWKEKLDLSVRRLSGICSNWSSILTTESFRKELDKTLNGIVSKRIRLDILEQFPIASKVISMTALNDEIFMLIDQPRHKNHVIKVYDRNDTANAKTIIPMPGTYPVSMTACSVSNCVYLALLNDDIRFLTVMCIAKNANHQYVVSPWVTKDPKLPISLISVSTSGNLILLSLMRGMDDDNVISVHDAGGTLKHQVKFPRDADTIMYRNVLEKSNGNLVLAYCRVHYDPTRMSLSEFDCRSGNVVRRYESSSVGEESCVNFADSFGRIMITDPEVGIELIDSEFNLLETYVPPYFQVGERYHSDLHYDSERNEIVHIHLDRSKKVKKKVLTRLRFS